MSSKDNFDLLEKFSNNSRKDKISALILTVTLCLLAIGIVFLALEIYKKNEKIKQQTEEIKEQIKKINQQEIDINRAAFVIDSLNTGIIVCQSSLDNTVKNMDNSLTILNQQLDKTISVNTTLQSSINASVNHTFPIQDSTTFDGDFPIVGNSNVNTRPPIANTNVVTSITKINPQVYIQYMPEFGNLEKSVAQSLKNTQKYKVWTSEKITTFAFANQVRYFNDADKATANKIAETIKRNNAIDIPVVKINNMKAPLGQIEIWLGENKKFNEADMIQRNESIIQKFNLEKK